MSEALAARGLCLEALLQDLGVSPQETDARVLSDAYNRVWELAVQRSADPALGLSRLGHPLVALGSLAHLVLSARHLLEALQHLQRFALLLSPAIQLELESLGHEVQIRVEFIKSLHAVPLQRYDFIANVLMQSLSWVTGKRILASRIDYPCAAPPNTLAWEAAFEAPLSFGASGFCIAFDPATLQQTIPTANAGVAALCLAEAQQRMTEHSGSVQRRVRQALMQELPKGDPKRDAIAALLCMSERTLQRRLLEESTSFNKLLDETRREQAERYLARGSISATEMSFALGFADPSNFYRACKRWFGQSPSLLRCPL